MGGEVPVFVSALAKGGNLDSSPFFRAQSTFLSSWKPHDWPMRGEAELGNGRTIHENIATPGDTSFPLGILVQHQAPVMITKKEYQCPLNYYGINSLWFWLDPVPKFKFQLHALEQSVICSFPQNQQKNENSRHGNLATHPFHYEIIWRLHWHVLFP